MQKTIVLLFSLLICACSLPAQSPAQKSGADGLTGCLKRVDNEFMLTDDEGTVHRLVGSDKKLSHELGHEIEVTGKPGTRTYDVTAPGGASNAIERQVFQVKTVKHIADICKY